MPILSFNFASWQCGSSMHLQYVLGVLIDHSKLLQLSMKADFIWTYFIVQLSGFVFIAFTKNFPKCNGVDSKSKLKTPEILRKLIAKVSKFKMSNNKFEEKSSQAMTKMLKY